MYTYLQNFAVPHFQCNKFVAMLPADVSAVIPAPVFAAENTFDLGLLLWNRTPWKVNYFRLFPLEVPLQY